MTRVEEKDLGFMLYDMDYTDREDTGSYVFPGCDEKRCDRSAGL